MTPSSVCQSGMFMASSTVTFPWMDQELQSEAMPAGETHEACLSLAGVYKSQKANLPRRSSVS